MIILTAVLAVLLVLDFPTEGAHWKTALIRGVLIIALMFTALVWERGWPWA